MPSNIRSCILTAQETSKINDDTCPDSYCKSNGAPGWHRLNILKGMRGKQTSPGSEVILLLYSSNTLNKQTSKNLKISFDFFFRSHFLQEAL